jgi:aspartyl-tRNA(Asn)/glutamyl-tRNA(Gln) amidotransferase subunit B
MEQGSMRCDVNLSVRPEGSTKLGVRTEMKNMNSISAIERAIAYETARHIDAIENGTEVLVQETRRWDDIKGKSFAMRTKETAGDYRYFPDPNVMPIVIDDEWYGKIEKSLPEFPEVKRARYTSELGLGDYDADLLTESRALCDCFEAAYAECDMAKEAANWLLSDVLNILNKKQMTADHLTLDGRSLGKLIKLVTDGKVSRPNAKKILAEMFEQEIDPAKYAEEQGYIVSGDTGAIEAAVREIVIAEERSVADYKSGKEKALMAIFGKCMKALKGNCDPQSLRQMIIDVINSL